ncbi:MAG: chloride channel protein [Proteobacteria bacterium]|nr:chloride channel protein [Pseudomonadota bacterium]MBT4106281.1 chloride channel protein [Pseudomonadota bacterium]MBT4357560.1 chloride channel protein [Pseudomonadota bacterium]MBT4986579.1 chloride channel protein [Pseudomonadota bacterium]MBT5189644.1 chloride channel protein [Pseudomonadota bacterium]
MVFRESPFVESLLRIAVGIVIGFIMAIAASTFLLIADFLSTVDRFIDPFFVDGWSKWKIAIPSVLLTAAAVLIFFVRRIFGIRRFHGPGDTIAAVQSNKRLDIRTGLGSTLVAMISVGGGASVGQYGPLVHFGGTVGAVISYIFKSKIPSSTWIGCGVAGAIAAGFGTPLAAIVFSHEVVLRRFSIPAIAPISLSAITASMVADKILAGKRTHFDQVIDGTMVELLPFVVLSAPVFAITAVLFMKFLAAAVDKLEPLSATSIWPSVTAALFCGLLGILVPGALGLGIDVIADLLHDNVAITAVVVLVLAKIIFTTVSIGAGLHGGIFLPAMFIGAGVGCLLGKAATAFGVVAGTSLSLAGMAAVSAAVFGAPISTVLIVLEFTRSYEATIFSIVAVTICTLISHQVYAPSFFERKKTGSGS